MFASKSSINNICKILFKTIQIVYNANVKLHKELLVVSKDISVHQKHLPILVIVVYKSLMRSNPDVMWVFYTVKSDPYDFHIGEKLYLPKANTARSRLNSLIFRETLLWNNLQTFIKISKSLTISKII